MHGSSLNGVNICNGKKALSHIHSCVISENAQWHFFIDQIVPSLKKEKRQQTLEISNHIRFLSGKVCFLVGFKWRFPQSLSLRTLLKLPMLNPALSEYS
jgi:hypothetical protein